MDTQQEPQNAVNTNNYSIPFAIVVAGALIAFALYSNPGSGSRGTAQLADTGGGQGGAAAVNNEMRPVDETDHILGNPNAPVMVVEYSDTECPFCKRHHVTMKQIMEEYGQDGNVAWVYRHLPLESLHRQAKTEAEATECAAKLGGNEAFWAFTDKIFEVTPSNDGLDLTLLPDFAEEAGLDRAQFELCWTGGEFKQKIEDSIAEATKAGAQGTPYSLVVVRETGQSFPINGALPYSAVKNVIDQALAEI